MASSKKRIKKAPKTGLIKLCMEKRMPLTQKRKLIISIIEKSSGHVDFEGIYREAKKLDPSIGIATVYRTLKLMREFQVVDHHSFGQEHKHFESPIKSHHDHLVCNECGNIIEFLDPTLEKLKLKIANSHQFRMQSHKLEIFGLCKTCFKKI